MQKPKKEIYHKILESAKEEFFENGFKKASLRTITKKSGIALSNIYNYFINKDSLLEVVLEPALKSLEEIFEEHNRKERITIEALFSM